MGAAEARALWQRTASRCFVFHEDAKMAPRLACCQHHHSSSGNTQKNSFSSGSFGDSSDFSCDTKWWLKGSTTGTDEEITNSFFENTKCKKLQEFVDLIGIREEEEDYSFISKNANASTPWWRSATDKDELALLVASKSVDHSIQNCDLPPPQKLHKRIHCTSGEKGFRTEVKSPWKQGVWSDRFERSLSYNSSTESKNTSQMSSPRSDDLSKAQLLEALRHSQTRAREAEKAAREACAEKDRLITILLRQASQMLAYKQWLKLLEMEALYMQMKEEEEEEEEQIKGINLKKRKQRGKKKKMCEIGRYMMAFALGFSLIGAGLFLGWTVGWLFTL
ncbi:hypothetical protein V5N11_035512 [Cardamine amara subsp. amara]|uniref:Transmembrane protein n=1 Tax=Cardamine amara subsp. amara TaxID=228776 RepID=A0ABD1BU36_CARAN